VVPEGKIDIVALGEWQNLSPAAVLKLQEENPNTGFAKSNAQALVWAYNHRVDIKLLPAGAVSQYSSKGSSRKQWREVQLPSCSD
jgi:hypothetical protein